MYNYVADILQRNNLSITDSRKTILSLFLKEGQSALRHSDIERATKKIDRVTIYRTLQVFTEKGIIHSIPALDGAARYALCNNGCLEGHHFDNHVHFVCTSCGTTQCIDHVNVPPIILPPGYQTTQVEMVVTGICKTCGQKN